MELISRITRIHSESPQGSFKNDLCPDCRYQIRLANRNEWNLYRRQCDLTRAPIISIYSPEKNYTVYDQNIWWADRFDGLDFGQKFDFSKTFFEQFSQLRHRVPRLAITNSSSQNSQFTNQSSHNKDCYLVVASNGNERCQYGNWYQRSLDCFDCYCVEECELSYECVNSSKLYQCFFLRNCDNCKFSWFSFDCHGCSNIFGCTGLYNKSYYIYNEPVSKDEWQKKIGELRLSHDAISTFEKKSRDVELQVFHKYYQGKQNEEFSGDYLEYCKLTFNAFNARRCWQVCHSQDAWEAKDCCDLTETLRTELCFELEGCADCYGCMFVNKSWNLTRSIYSELCFNSSELVGCIGLKKNQHCIFNVQYSKHEFDSLKEKIIRHMIETGEWGRFFPAAISCFGYNESVAQEYFPLSRKKADLQRFTWSDNIPSYDRNFKIQSSEKEFYDRFNLPYPIHNPDLRRMYRYGTRNPRSLWTRNCVECSTSIESSFAPRRPEKIACEECYLESIVN